MSAVEQCLAVEFKCEFAEVIRLVVEIGERLEQAVGEMARGLEYLEEGLRAGAPRVDVYDTRDPALGIPSPEPRVKGASCKNVGGC